MNGENLLKVASQLAPGMTGNFEWADIWQRPIENGASYEWTMIAALIHEAEDNGYVSTFPLSKFAELKQLFPLRNEVPFQHAAQAGHSLGVSAFSLAETFRASLLPKVTLQGGSKTFSIFTEGYPYHKLMSSKVYTERPDIVIVEGRVVDGMPALTGDDAFIDFEYDPVLLPPVSGQLRTIKSSMIPMTKRNPTEGCELPVLTIIETSINKSYKHALNQISRYREIFSTREYAPNLFLVAGNSIQGADLDSYFTDLNSSDVTNDFRLAARDILKKSGLI